MKKITLLFLLLGTITISCDTGEDETKVKPEVEIPAEYKENPTTVEWEAQDHDFGEISNDTVVKYVYKFKNTGNNPLIVADCKATCGCTVPECKQPPIAPGKSGTIEVKFNSKNKANKVSKTVKVYMNTDKAYEEVRFKVFVNDGMQDIVNDKESN